MASSATARFSVEITGDAEGGADYITYTWAVMTPVINNTLTVDLALGSNVLLLDPYTAPGLSPKMVMIVPPSTNTETLVLVGSDVRINKTEPTVLFLDTATPVVSITIVATGTVSKMRLIVL